MVAMAAGDSETLLLTTNGGATWKNLTSNFDASIQSYLSSASTFSFHAVAMVSPTVAYVSATSGVILRTINGGALWSLDYAAPKGSAGILSIAMSRSSSGMLGIAGFARSSVPSQSGRVITRSADPSISPTPEPTK